MTGAGPEHPETSVPGEPLELQPAPAIQPPELPAWMPAQPFPALAPVPRPWGFWATLGLSAACLGALVFAQMIAIVPFAIQSLSRTGGDQRFLADLKTLDFNGLYISLAVPAAALACVPLVVLLVRIRRLPIPQYLGLRPLKLKQTLIAAALLAALIAALNAALHFAPVPEGPSQADIYRTSVFPPLLILVLVLVAPAYEEVLFRGFLFKGIAESRAGPVVAVLITALAWAGIHLQYNPWQMGYIFILGLFLGGVRRITGSVSLTILLHGIINVAAVIGMMIEAHSQG